MKWEMETLSPSPYVSQANWFVEENRNTKWTPAENKLFENALAVYDADTPDRWHKVAAMIPGKTVGDVMKQYQELEADVSDIEAGLVPIPGYSNSANSPSSFGWVSSSGYVGFKGLGTKRSSLGRTPEQERKKGVPWTEEEHKLFLLGLKKYGKGDWRNISRNFVITRTPTQVASHAQKYFIRQLSGGKDKRRASIHDITTVNLTDTTRTVTCSSSSSSSREDRKRSGSPQQHQPDFINGTTQRAHFQRNQANAVVLNNNGHEKMFMSPYGITMHGQNMHRSALHHVSSYLGPQAPNMGFQMPSTQHYYSHA